MGERYFVAYEGLTTICSACGLYGHMVHACPRTVHERDVVVSSSNLAENTKGNTLVQMEEGFTRVRAARRRPENRMQKEGIAAGNMRGDGGGNRRELAQSKDTANITVANRFGNLGEDIGIPDITEEVMLLGDNKENENENILNQPQKEKSGVHGKMVVFGAKSGTGMGGVRDGARDTRVGPSKNQTSNGPKPRQQKVNKPMRGLVFGPGKGETELSVNGKRLRVESTSAGRAGGYFVIEEEGSKDAASLAHARLETEECAQLELGGISTITAVERLEKQSDGEKGIYAA